MVTGEGGPLHRVVQEPSVWQLVTGHAAVLAVLGGGGFVGLSAVETFQDPPAPATSVSASPRVEVAPYSAPHVQAVEALSTLEPRRPAPALREDRRRPPDAASAADQSPGSVRRYPSSGTAGTATTPGPAAALAAPLTAPPAAPPAAPPVDTAPGSPAPAVPPTPVDDPPREPAVARLATLNVLGHAHTTPRGNKPGYASGPVRMHRSVQVLAAKDVDLVGFQEFEEPQYREFQRITGGSWGVFPAMTMGSNPVRNSIAWRKDTWSVVSSGTIPVPYFHGNRVPMPWVLLQHDASSRRLAVINIHNPTSNKRRGNNERWRDLGTTLEIGLVNRLRSAAPVVLIGDFNEREEAFCKVTAGAAMHAANGGTSAPCRPPAGAGIDWIFGTSDIAFSAYERFTSPLLRSATDHPLIVATARLGG